MEQITLTKQELIEIVEREVNKKISGVKKVTPVSIFSDIRLHERDIAETNETFPFTKSIRTPYRGRHFQPLSLNKHHAGNNGYRNGKIHDDQIHDHIRKLTLAVFGVSRNSELNDREIEDARNFYNTFKDMYLHLYKKRLSKLTIDDFE